MGSAWRAATSQSSRRVAAALVVLASLFFRPAMITGPLAADDRGLSIMEEQRRVNSGYQDEMVLFTMILLNAKGDRSERTLEMRTLEGPEGGDKTLLLFKDQPDVSGKSPHRH